MVFSREWALVLLSSLLLTGFPRRERGRVGAFWNISHNVGGGIVAPIVGAAFALLGSEHWQSASYIVPACVAIVFAVIVLILGKGSHVRKVYPLEEMMPEEKSS